jgi:uncharacterized SAM-binding protein YcdF (DUF218 family)
MRRTIRSLVFTIAVLTILLWFTPLADVYSAPLVVASDARRSDVIVLMSSGLIDRDWVTPDAAQRTWGALKLYKENFAPFVISVGSDQAEVQADMLERAGVPRDAILVDRAPNTHWSAIAVSRIMKDHDWRSAAIVTSQYDVPRVRMVFEKLGVSPSFLPVPEFRKPERFHIYRHAAFDITCHATYEYAAIVWYKLHGWF